MTPEDERYLDALDAAMRWRDEQRRLVLDPPDQEERRYRRVWVDSGSGPGFEVLVPED